MKTLKFGLLTLLAILFLSCNQDKTENKSVALNTDKESIEGVVPEAKHYFTKAQFQEAFDAEIQHNIRLGSDELMKDATDVVNATKKAITSIADSSYVEAKNSIELGIGKAEAITALNPELALAPVDFEIGTNDLIADISSIKAVKDLAEEALDDGRIQEAAQLLDGLKSEIEIKTYSLPIATYRIALKQALVLAKEKKYKEASTFLNATLNTIVVEKKRIPLPLIRAEHILKKLDETVQEKDFDQKLAKQLLENASYELKFAEALGYGKKDKEFKELNNAVKEISKVVKNTSNTDEKGLLQKLRAKLSEFKERIS
ncbi:YfdX family protein [Kordia algicida OT-1]|nr:YfdX family protein [Kordia algicida]